MRKEKMRLNKKAIIINFILLVVCVLGVVCQPAQNIEAKKVSSMKSIIEDTIEIPMIFLFNGSNCDEQFSFSQQMKALIGARVTYAEKQKQHFDIQSLKTRMKNLFGSSEIHFINTTKNPFCMMKIKDEKITYLSGNWGRFVPEYRIVNIKKKSKGSYICRIKTMLVDKEYSKLAFQPEYVEYKLKKANNKYGYIILDIDLMK